MILGRLWLQSSCCNFRIKDIFTEFCDIKTFVLRLSAVSGRSHVITRTKTGFNFLSNINSTTDRARQGLALRCILFESLRFQLRHLAHFSASRRILPLWIWLSIPILPATVTAHTSIPLSAATSFATPAAPFPLHKRFCLGLLCMFLADFRFDLSWLHEGFFIGLLVCILLPACLFGLHTFLRFCFFLLGGPLCFT